MLRRKLYSVQQLPHPQSSQVKGARQGPSCTAPPGISHVISKNPEMQTPLRVLFGLSCRPWGKEISAQEQINPVSSIKFFHSPLCPKNDSVKPLPPSDGLLALSWPQPRDGQSSSSSQTLSPHHHRWGTDRCGSWPRRPCPHLGLCFLLSLSLSSLMMLPRQPLSPEEGR